MRTQDKEQIHLYVTPDEKKLLQARATQRGQTLTQVMRELIQTLR